MSHIFDVFLGMRVIITFMRKFVYCKILFFSLLLFLPEDLFADTAGDSLTVSLITCSPGSEAYERFGHTAIRVQRPAKKIDIIYNYGMFSFSTPNFIYRFTKGETDYWLGIDRFRDFLFSYAMRNSTVYQQQLNLTQAEAHVLFDALNRNSLPENRVYRYNFLFDNCSTRAEDIILQNAGGVVRYDTVFVQGTFRSLIHACTKPDKWLTFGIDLALGSRIDKPITFKESLFLPDNLMKAFASAQIETDSVARDLVCKTDVLISSDPEEADENEGAVLSPLAVSWMVAIFAALLSVWQYRRGRQLRWFDSLLFLLYGITGCVLFFLMFVSEHPATYPNYSAFWLHPFHLFIAVAVWLKSAKKIVYYYHFINFAVLIAFLLLWNVIPQQFNEAFIGLIVAMLVRSACGVAMERKSGQSGAADVLKKKR